MVVVLCLYVVCCSMRDVRCLLCVVCWLVFVGGIAWLMVVRCLSLAALLCVCLRVVYCLAVLFAYVLFVVCCKFALAVHSL